MIQEHMPEIEEIIGRMGRMRCPKDFKCYKSGFETLCKVRDVGMQTFLECLEPNSHECPFSKILAAWHICECPLRVYIAKELKK